VLLARHDCLQRCQGPCACLSMIVPLQRYRAVPLPPLAVPLLPDTQTHTHLQCCHLVHLPHELGLCAEEGQLGVEQAGPVQGGVVIRRCCRHHHGGVDEAVLELPPAARQQTQQGKEVRRGAHGGAGYCVLQGCSVGVRVAQQQTDSKMVALP
jgi:hypothetical protein